jgi:hypothetical protein
MLTEVKRTVDHQLGLLALLAVIAGCGSKHIGRPCELGVAAGGLASGGAVVISSSALECPSRLCLLSPATADGADPGAMCTAACEIDDDCADADTAPTAKEGGCRGGFGCGWPTTVGPFCCQKMCICRDLVPEPKGGYVEPAACKTPAGGCVNVR